MRRPRTRGRGGFGLTTSESKRLRGVEALIWERGAGWTMASGSSACAVAAACVRTGRTDRSLDVSMPGGVLQVTVEESWEIFQTGHTQEIAIGTLSADLLSDLEGVE